MWYSDASFLVSLFGDDSRSPDALRWLRNAPGDQLAVSRLTLLEFGTAIKAAVNGGKLSEEKAELARLLLKQALTKGLIKRRELSPHQWFPQAERITAHAATASTCRALDVLHVAAAVLLKQSGFLTFDAHQAELALSEGLRVMP
jgi:predicted nucleic acid-binding protein